jgi:hypothetical protein
MQGNNALLLQRVTSRSPTIREGLPALSGGSISKQRGRDDRMLRAAGRKAGPPQRTHTVNNPVNGEDLRADGPPDVATWRERSHTERTPLHETIQRDAPAAPSLGDFVAGVRELDDRCPLTGSSAFALGRNLIFHGDVRDRIGSSRATRFDPPEDRQRSNGLGPPNECGPPRCPIMVTHRYPFLTLFASAADDRRYPRADSLPADRV